MARNQLKTGVVLSYLSQALHILITLFYTPIMLRLLGQSEFGVYQIVYSVVGFLSLMNFGFSSSYIKFYTIAKRKDNSQVEIAKLNGSFLVIFLCLAALVLVLGLWMAINTDYILGGKMSVSELNTAQILMFLLVFNCVTQFIYVVFINYLIANEKFIALQVLNIIVVCLNPCLTFPMLLMGYGSIGMGVALLSISLFQLLFGIYYCFTKLRMKFIFRDMKWGIFKDIGIFSFYIFLESVVSLINISLDRFLLGKLVGSVAAAIYAVGGQINTLYTTLSTTISSVFTPRINRMVEEGNRNKELSDLFIKIGKIQFVVLYMILCGFVIYGRRFMDIWVGKGYEEAYYVALILIIPNTINLIQNVAYEIQRAKYMQKYRSYMWICVALFNVFISIFLIQWLGASGAALGTGIAWVIGSGFLMNWFYARYVALDVVTFWKEICFMSKGGIVPLVIGFMLSRFLSECHISLYFASMLLFGLIYSASMYYIGFGNQDKLLAKDYAYQFLYKIGFKKLL